MEVEKNGKRTLMRHGPLIFLGVLLAGLLSGGAMQTQESDDSTRKLISSVPPEYPELARRLNLRGTTRVQLTVAPDGRVVSVKELGGNPVLVEALTRAVKKWKYEAAKKESLIVVKFDFNP
ncbi:MAG TPA: energy transducer TonB [Verrucomicrobiae bacterium]|nr:energy transducer TonB [Verrucomicrobiae bacterium]